MRELGVGVMDGDVFSHRKRPREDEDTHNSTARVVEAALAEVRAAKLSKERRSLATPKDVRFTSGLSLDALKDGGDAEGLTMEVKHTTIFPQLVSLGTLTQLSHFEEQVLANEAAKQRNLMRSEYAAESTSCVRAFILSSLMFRHSIALCHRTSLIELYESLSQCFM